MNIDVFIDDQAEIVRKCVEFNLPIIFLRDKNTPKVEGKMVYEVDSWPEIYRTISRLSTDMLDTPREAKSDIATYLTEESKEKPPSWNLA